MLKLTDFRSKNKFAIPEHQVTAVEQPIDQDTNEPKPFRMVWVLSPVPFGAEEMHLAKSRGMLTNFTVVLHPFEVEESYDELCAAIGQRPHPQTLNVGG